jgi:hypothetical protein
MQLLNVSSLSLIFYYAFHAGSRFRVQGSRFAILSLGLDSPLKAPSDMSSKLGAYIFF